MDTTHTASSPLAQARISYACRLVDKTRLSDTLAQPVVMAEGQLALAEIVQRAPQEGVVLADGSFHYLRPHTRLLVAVGETRSALGRSGTLPHTPDECHLLTPYGLVGKETARGAKMGEAVQLRLLGLPLMHDGSVATLADFAETTRGLRDVPRTYLLLGCAQRVGETQTLLNWAEGLSVQDPTVDLAVILLGDWPALDLPVRLFDAGVTHVLDAANLGLPNTHHLDGNALLDALDDLRTLAGLRGARHCLIALGGGYDRPEMQRLLATGKLPTRIDGAILAAADALSARTVAQELEAYGVPLLGLSGTLAGSPLAIRETQPLDTPILASEDLTKPPVLTALVAQHYSRCGGRYAHLHNPFN